ncbi:MAG: hypothetical protein V4736_03030 [Bdellovibrionota bacterium]
MDLLLGPGVDQPAVRRYHFQVADLISFQTDSPNIELTGDADIYENHLLITFELSDPKNLIAASLGHGSWKLEHLRRADELWKKTCFEAFLSIPGEKKYWELNIATDGEWNIYSFDDYRTPQPPKESTDFHISKLITTPQSLTCELTTKLKFPELDYSLCAIIKMRDGNTFYYSTNHAGQKPDFHIRDSLSLQCFRE